MPQNQEKFLENSNVRPFHIRVIESLNYHSPL